MAGKKKNDETGMSVRINDSEERIVTITDPDNLPKSYLEKNKAYQKKVAAEKSAKEKSAEDKHGSFVTRHKLHKD